MANAGQAIGNSYMYMYGSGLGVLVTAQFFSSSRDAAALNLPRQEGRAAGKQTHTHLRSQLSVAVKPLSWLDRAATGYQMTLVLPVKDNGTTEAIIITNTTLHMHVYYGLEARVSPAKPAAN